MNAVMAGSHYPCMTHIRIRKAIKRRQTAKRIRPMDNLSPHGFNAAVEPSRRGFLIAVVVIRLIG